MLQFSFQNLLIELIFNILLTTFKTAVCGLCLNSRNLNPTCASKQLLAVPESKLKSKGGRASAIKLNLAEEIRLSDFLHSRLNPDFCELVLMSYYHFVIFKLFIYIAPEKTIKLLLKMTSISQARQMAQRPFCKDMNTGLPWNFGSTFWCFLDSWTSLQTSTALCHAGTWAFFTEPDISDSHNPITPKLGKFYAFKYKQSKQCAQKLVS